MPQMTQIKASAGSGKTYTLTRQFLQHLAACSPRAPRTAACAMDGPQTDWRSVMAITFTNAAATEMQERVLKVLKQRALGLDNSDDITMRPGEARIWLDRILHDRASLNISTIDSLLNLIVRMSALTENLPPDFTPVFTTKELLKPYWDAVSNEAWQGDPLLRTLIREICQASLRYDQRKSFQASGLIFSRLAELMPLIFTGKVDELTPLEEFQTEDGEGRLPALRRHILANLVLLLSWQDRPVPETGGSVLYHANFIKALQKIRGVIEEGLGEHRANPSLADFAKLRLDDALFGTTYLTKPAPVTRKGSAPLPDEVLDAFTRLRHDIDDLLGLDRLHRQGRMHEPLLELARIIYDRYEKNQQSEGLVPNDRIPVMVERILSGDHGVAEALCRLGTRISHFLVDEFQDTSRDHWAALRPLVAEALAGGGSFSWVGDVKQAIYGFRGGDSQLFDDICDEQDLTCLLEGGVRRQTLDANWRSRAEIIAFNNALFSPLDDADLCAEVLALCSPSLNLAATCRDVPSLIPDAPDPGQTLLGYTAGKMARAYAQAAQKESDRTKGGGKVRLVSFSKGMAEETGPEGDEDNETAADDPQFSAVSGIVCSEHRTRPWSDFLVLVRTNNQALQLARFLSQQGIPVITENSLLLGDHPLIVQTLALLAFLRAPEDDIAFWTLVSGSILGRGDPADVESERPWLDESLLGLSCARRRHRDEINLGEMPVSLARQWQDAYPGAWETMIEPLLEAGGSITPYDLVFEWYDREQVFERFPEARPFLSRFLEILHTSLGRGIRSLGDFLDYWNEHGGEEKVPMPEGMDAVRIMTVHKAKGLQAPVVLVPWTSNRPPSGAPMEVLEYLPWGATRPLRALCTRSKVFPAWTAHRLRTAFEAVNRFYVAFTRAEEALYVFVSEKPMGDGKLLQKLLETAEGSIPAAVPWPEFAQALDAEAAGTGQDAGSETAPGTGSETGSEPGPEPGSQPAPETARATGAGSCAADGTGDGAGAGPQAGGSVPQAQDEDVAADDSLVAPARWRTDGREGAAADPDWRPMDWLPRLRLHFDYVDEMHPRDLAREEGIFVHGCLEELARYPHSVLGDGEAFANLLTTLLETNMGRSPWLDSPDFRDRVRDEILWFGRLNRRHGWIARGLPEQSITTARGKVLRTDLLVTDPRGPIVLEYKHGLAEEEFLRDYHAQVLAYLHCLRAARKEAGQGTGPRPLGIIVYLRPRRLHLVLPDGTSFGPHGPVEGDRAPLVLLDEDEFAGAMACVRP